ncbi:MAG TPA: PilC/PilY family type IV pilus protein, partial [Burkholderiales bacterium]|nr:PilC/PilY family type IV pilus protein [Burkholderiales bacterium]
MKSQDSGWQSAKIAALVLLGCLAAFSASAGAASLNLDNVPLYINSNVQPIVMLDITKDHALYKKAYNDYTDLDANGVVDSYETTYWHQNDYYGYFDPVKCYDYDTVNNVFFPVAISPGSNKYCNTITSSGHGTWSGNFLNWATMTRMDLVRKLLYGGKRSTDLSTAPYTTILERALLPPDGHSFSKFYAGSDIAWLTPYNPTITPNSGSIKGSAAPTGSSPPYSYGSTVSFKVGSSATLLTSGTNNFQNRFVYYFRQSQISVCRGDQVKVAIDATHYMVGVVWDTDQGDCSTASTSGNGGFTLAVDHPTGLVGAASSSSASAWTVTDLTNTGISLCNVTLSSGGTFSETDNDPPSLRVAKGNFALWAHNDWKLCHWNPGAGPNQLGVLSGGGNGNFASVTLGNNPLASALTQTSNSGSSGPPNTFVPASLAWASATSPLKSVQGLAIPGSANYEFTMRVKACVSNALIGTEQCKLYGNGTSLKPTGLMQVYGDPGVDSMYFGLFTGSYAKNKSGGVLRKNAGTFTNEVDANTGVFLRPASGSIVDNLDRFRLYGYSWYGNINNPGDPTDTTGNYADNGTTTESCPTINPDTGTGPPGSYANRADFSEGRCTSWGNPISEMYLESLRYLAHKSPDPRFTYSGTTPDSILGLSQPSWNDPLTSNTYCAPLNAVVINGATQSFDSDQLDKITDLNTAQTAAQWTNLIGDSQHENINGGKWIVGNSDTLSNNICSSKTVNLFGNVSGICPEQPRYQGSYNIAGVAYAAHTNKIRTDLAVPSTDTNSLKVTTSTFSLSPNVPAITIPVGAKKVTIMPAGMFEDKIVTFGPGEIVDFKMIKVGSNATGPFGTYLVQWDENGAGADYELDISGIISYQVNNATSQITVSTKVAGRGGNGCDGFGYVITGTTEDGAHFYSGIQDSNSANWSINGGNGCRNAATATTTNPGFYYQYTSPSGTVTTECKACIIDSNPQVPSMSHTFNVVGGGGTLQDPLWYVAKYGGFHDLNGNGIPDQTAEWDSVINNTGLDGSDGLPDNYFPVTNPNRLQIALDRAFTQILGVSSSTSVATNSTSLNTGTRIFQARFNSADWSGQLLSYPIDLNGNISSAKDWDSGQQINGQTPASRVILSYNPTSGVAHNNSGIPFEWANVGAIPTLAAYLNQNAGGVVDALGSSRLAYLRGDASLEGTSANKFRRRPASKLGDIINSNPQYVGAPSSSNYANYADPTYGTFASNYALRTPVVYMGANDGLLHGFNALQSTASGGGKEVLGYVPSRIYSDLPKYMSQNYVHRYYVDGTANVQDVCTANTALPAGTNFCPAASNWKSVLVGDLRAGGQGVFALDVTDPSQFTEANANKLALWEFTDSDDADLGFVYDQPQIGKMANGKWAVVFGNGYDNTYSCTIRPCPNMGGAEGPLDNHASATGHGVLYILFIQDGATSSSWVAGTNFIKLDTKVGTSGSPNGLAQPVLVDTNGDGVVDYIYVGDLQGNMWKFDVTNSNPTNWASAFNTGSNPQPFFTATDASNNPQPITSAPVVYPNPQGGRMVLFGTGLYLQAIDQSNLSQQTLYGIWDNGSQVSGRSKLVAQTVLANATTSAGNFRVTS